MKLLLLLAVAANVIFVASSDGVSSVQANSSPTTSSDGTEDCLEEENSVKCNGPHEYFSCGGACDNVCSKLSTENQTNCPIINIKCNEMCYCEEGYARDDNETCIAIDECKVQCGKNEEYNECPSLSCKALNCSQLGYPVPCPFISINATCPSRPACICKDGYLRNKKGICVPENTCPSCGGDPNAQPGCGQNCGKRCSNYNKGPVGCAQICKVNGCDCKERYVYDDNIGKCVRPNECTPVCGYNEIYSSCIQGQCMPQNCTQLGQSVACPRIDPKFCQKGCLCKEGYLRDKNGTCIPEKKCPISCGDDPNAQPGCGQNCGRRCSDYNKGPVECADICEENGCDCKEGYVYDDNIGKCVRTTDCTSCGGDPNAVSGCGVNCNKHCYDLNGKPRGCPKICRVNACDCKEDYYYDDNIGKCVSREQCTPTCGDDEVFSDCVNGGCEMKNCSQLGKPTICIDPLHCIAGCLCKEGYLRADNGTCVPEDQCKPSCTNPNEVYDPCPPTCPPQTCESISQIYNCPFIPANNTDKDCSGQCRCKPGYYRNIKDECISKDDCLKCTEPNEYFSCGSVCDNVCTTLFKQNQTNCPIKNIKCTEKCYCKEAYARDENNTCIPIEECPASCGGDTNAKAGCGINCNRRCSDYNQEPRACIALCKMNACDCKEGFYYDDNIDKCVLLEECTPTCGDDEVFSDCVNGGCEMKNCSQLGKPTICIDPLHCIAGCLCKEGYLRADNGTCVPEDQCKPSCTNPNEVYDPCPPTCPPQTCESISQIYNCPFIPANNTDKDCSGQCRCKPGYYRNIKDECISKDDCLKCTGPNEYFSCGSVCDNVCTTLFKQNQTNCPIKNIKCTEKCYCKEAYARDENNTCIPIEECPASCGGDTNAKAGCGINCNRRCSDYNQEPRACIALCKMNACDCKEGFYYDDNIDKCVLLEECTFPETTLTTPPPTTTTSPPTTTAPELNDNSTEQLQLVNEGAVSYTGVFAYQRYLMNPGTSFVASPFSVLVPVALLGYFSGNSTLDQILAVLNLKNKEDILIAFQLLREEYLAQTSVILEEAVKCYVNKDYPTTELFNTIAEKYFGSESQNVDFAQAQQTANIINKWVEDKTHDKIKNLVSPSMFSGDTRLVLVNAIYFMGNWTRPFNIEDTETKDFYVPNNKTIKIPMMHQMGFFNYGEDDDLNSQIVELSYNGGNYSCIIVLPKDIDGLEAVMEKLSKSDTYTKATGNLRSEKVDITVPRFEIETETDLAKMFEKTNLGQLLNSSLNDIHISTSKEPLHVSSAVQKAYIKFNEAGTEAAAANAIIVGTTSVIFPAPKIYEFNANHPFVLYVVFQQIPIFCAVFAGV